jgi:hypothetical protein
MGSTGYFGFVVTNKHYWAYCSCGWITFAATQRFADDLVSRHLWQNGSAHVVTPSRQTPEERERDLARQRAIDLARTQDLDPDLEFEHDPDGVPGEINDSPTAHFTRR